MRGEPVEHDDMYEAVRFMRRFSSPTKLELLVRDHRADPSGHCPSCRSVGPCTIYTVALHARRPNGAAPTPAA